MAIASSLPHTYLTLVLGSNRRHNYPRIGLRQIEMVINSFKSTVSLLFSLGLSMSNGMGVAITALTNERVIVVSAKNMDRCDRAVQRIMADRI